MVGLSNQSGVGWQGLNLGAVGAETDRRGFIPVNEKMQVLGKDGKVVPHVYCIGDANGARPVVSCMGRVHMPELNMDLQSAEVCLLRTGGTQWSALAAPAVSAALRMHMQ